MLAAKGVAGVLPPGRLGRLDGAGERLAGWDLRYS